MSNYYSGYNGQYAPVPSDPQNAQTLNKMAQIASERKIITDYAAEEKKIAALVDESNREQSLNNLHNTLSWRQVTNLCCRPSWSADVDVFTGLPPDMLRYIEELHGQTGWDRQAILLALLETLAMALRGRYKLQLDDDWLEAIVLYSFIIAESGLKKSELAHKLKGPQVEFATARQEAFSENAQNKLKPSDIKQVKNRAMSIAAKKIPDCLSMADVFAATLSLQKEATTLAENCKNGVTTLPQLFADSFTTKKLIQAMPEQGGGFNIFEAEGGSLLNLANTRGADLDILLKGYTMESFSRENMREASHIANPFLNMCYMVQPDIARQLYQKTHLKEIGLLPRFLICFAEAPLTTGTQYGQEYAEHRISSLGKTSCAEDYSKKIQSMLARNYTQNPKREIYVAKADAEAYRQIKEFECYISTGLAQGHFANAQPFMRKLHGTAGRIAFLIHAWRYDQPEAHLISGQDMQLGISIANMLMPHADYAFSPSGLCAYTDAQKILAWVRKHKCGRFTSRDIGQGVENMRKENIFPALDLLAQHNVLAQLIIPNRSRECVVHPQFNYYN